MSLSKWLAVALTLVCLIARFAHSAEVVQLTEENWERFAPHGKEVDCIYGDYVLRSDRIVAVVARPGELRHANLTVRSVGGALIDLTRVDRMSDQLSAFYPHGGSYVFSGPVTWPEAFSDEQDKDIAADSIAQIAFSARKLIGADGATPPLELVVGYQLADGNDYLTVISRITNRGDTLTSVVLEDGIRADGEFEFGLASQSNLWWARDAFWEQAYGVQPADEGIAAAADWSDRPRDPRRIRYDHRQGQSELAPGESLTLTRRVIPGRSELDVRSVARRLADRPREALLCVQVNDPAGPVRGASVEIFTTDDPATSLGVCRTGEDGRCCTSLPPGEFNLSVRAQGRSEVSQTVSMSAGEEAVQVRLAAPGYAVGEITAADGRAIPCKVAFLGQEGIADPNFGPDSAIFGVRNLRYTPDGKFRVALLPGRYAVVISHGPEYDSELRQISVAAGQETRIEAQLARVVDSTGWLSADFHSHSSPSGDNTSHQRGRVLNLLAEHIEFGPCTEHNRISSYVPHLQYFAAESLMATCCGMELTGQPLPINHQNAFPLEHHPRTQDGGAPTTDANPVVQIERLALWDDGSEKFVQINHPNIVQMVGDRDQDNVADGGFERMFRFMDVIEVHPPEAIFHEQTELNDPDYPRGNTMFNWLQLLNLGYRTPGVVNTDAHWNFHGSGWLRNYFRSPTDAPAEAAIEDIVQACERGQIVMTNGPFLTVEAESDSGQLAGPGDDLAAPDGQLKLRVRVQCPNWLDVNRVQVFVNGRPDDQFNYLRRRSPEMFRRGPVIFDEALDMTLSEDAHLVVATIGEGGRLGLVYGNEQGDAAPVAVANPVFVDVDGGGFQANGDMLGLPLPVAADHAPSKGHTHRP